MNTQFRLLFAISVYALIPRSVCARTTTKSPALRSQPSSRVQKLVKRTEATWQQVLKEQKVKFPIQGAYSPPISFDQAQHQLEAEIKRHPRATDKVALQNALADLHFARGKFWLLYSQYAPGDKDRKKGARMSEFHYRQAYNSDKLLRREKSFQVLVKLAAATFDVTRLKKQEAFRMIEQAIAYYRETQNIPALADALCYLAVFQASFSHYDDAMSCLNEAKTLYSKVPGVFAEKSNLWWWVASIHNARGEFADQESALKKAIKLAQAGHSATDEIACYTQISWLYAYNLDQQDKAIPWFEKIVMLSKRHPRHEGIQWQSRQALVGIGYAQVKMANYSKATSVLLPLLARTQKAADTSNEAMCLLVLGDMYLSMKRYAESSRYCQKAATRFREADDPRMQGISLYRVGRSYMNLGRNSEALRFFRQALQLNQKAENVLEVADTLGALSALYAQRKQPRVAILYGKQAVNLIQLVRSRIAKLDQSTKNDFLKSNEETYRTLIRLLIDEGRYDEADKVLSMLKENEFDQFVRRLPRGPQREQVSVPLNAQEKRVIAEDGRLLDNLSTLSGEMWTLQAVQHPTPQQKARLAVVASKIKKIQGETEAFFNARKELSAQDTRDMLRAWGGHVAQVSTFLSDRGLDLIVTLPQGPTMRLVYPASDAKTGGKPFKAWLSARIYEFVTAIEQGAKTNNSEQVNNLATELNNILSCHGELHNQLQGADPSASITTVMWRLTDVLRAIPLAALRDKDGYWVEKYQNVLLSASSHSPAINDNPQQNWKALGLGVTKAWTVKGERFPPLLGVKGELQAVVNAPSDGFSGGVLPGRVLEDSKFNEKSFFSSLHRPSRTASAPWQVIHIASHFKVFAEASESYLLLGDGKALTLSTLQNHANQEREQELFGDVDLVTLSACQTAQGADSLGELVVQNGAKSVIGTLWPVADKETAQLMGDFYNTYAGNKANGKAAALQQAQLALIHSGTASARPYYWAPFVLMGNWK